MPYRRKNKPQAACQSFSGPDADLQSHLGRGSELNNLLEGISPTETQQFYFMA
jgi:hypothetical protein